MVNSNEDDCLLHELLAIMQTGVTTQLTPHYSNTHYKVNKLHIYIYSQLHYATAISVGGTVCSSTGASMTATCSCSSTTAGV